MPLLTSTYSAPFFCGNRHLQTIYPSFFRKEKPMAYVREKMDTPDGDFLFLDWARCSRETDTLMIMSIGLCGYTQRHYVISTMRACNQMGIDGLAWNYRGHNRCPNQTLAVSTNNSTDELDWVIRHALSTGRYRHILLCGYSMGGNITLLYMGRNAGTLPPEIDGAITFCSPIDLNASIQCMKTPMGRIYAKHFVRQLVSAIKKADVHFPGRLNTQGIDSISTFDEFDNRYTAPIMGFKDAVDYWTTASACRWIAKINRPTLLVNPANDPFLGGYCYPADVAQSNPYFYLEIPPNGGHCGFITSANEWWPITRTRQFIQSLDFYQKQNA